MGVIRSISVIFLALFLSIVFLISVMAVTAEGEAWKVGTSTKILEMSENAATGANRETIGQIVNFQFIDESELPELLESSTAANSKGAAPYDQRLYFEGNNTGYVMYTEDDNDVTADFLYFSSGGQIARYELEFTTPLKSDIDDAEGNHVSTGLFLTDFEGTNLKLLGKSYEIVNARRTSTAGGGVSLILMEDVVKDSLTLGTTKAYSIDGNDYEVTLDFVDFDSAKLTINGETTSDLVDGQIDAISDGTIVGISKILFQDFAGGVHSAEFFLGTHKIELRDNNVRDHARSHDLKVDDESIDDAEVVIEGTDNNITFEIDKISINMTADDDFFIPAGGKLSENPDLAEPAVLFTENWDITYQGLSEEFEEFIRIQANGYVDYEILFVDSRGNVARFPLVNIPAANTLKFGDDDNDLIINETKIISKDDYFLISDSTDENGDRASFAMRYRGSDKSTDEDPKLKFDDLGSGENLERPMSVGSTINIAGLQSSPFSKNHTALMASIKIGGATFNVYNASSHTSASDMNIFVDLNGDEILSINSPLVTLNTQFGAQIAITNASSNGVTVAINTPNTEDFDDLTPSPFIFNVSGDSSGEGNLAKSAKMVHQFRTPEDEDDNEYAYSSYGALALYTSPSSNPEELTVTYPSSQRVPQVFIIGDASFEDDPTDGCSTNDILCKVDTLNQEIFELQNTISNQNQRIIALELWKEDAESRLTSAEFGISTLENIVDMLSSAISNLESWLFFFENDDICGSIENECDFVPEPDIECSTDDECEVEQEIGLFCNNADVWQSYEVGVCEDAGTANSFCDTDTVEELAQECDFGCSDGACLPEPNQNNTVIFRTNVDEGDYYDEISNAWIVLDNTGNSSLDAYGINGRSSWSSERCNTEKVCDGSKTPCIVIRTPTNDKVVDYARDGFLVVCDEKNRKQVFYQLNDLDAALAEVSSSPTEPYSSNNQEIQQ